VVGLVIYISVSIGALRTSLTPLEHETLDLRQEAIRVFAAGNVLIAGCLLGVLLMQVRVSLARWMSASWLLTTLLWLLLSTGRAGVCTEADRESPQGI